jgi:hypothetical protein
METQLHGQDSEEKNIVLIMFHLDLEFPAMWVAGT